MTKKNLQKMKEEPWVQCEKCRVKWLKPPEGEIPVCPVCHYKELAGRYGKELNRYRKEIFPDNLNLDDPNELWESFWKEICCSPDGALDIEQVKLELRDFSFIISQVRKVYDHITNGSMSNLMYFAGDVIRKSDDHISELVEEAEEEAIKETKEPLEVEIKDLVEALKPLAAIPFEDFDWKRHEDTFKFMSWNNVSLTIGDVKKARQLVKSHSVKGVVGAIICPDTPFGDTRTMQCGRCGETFTMTDKRTTEELYDRYRILYGDVLCQKCIKSGDNIYVRWWKNGSEDHTQVLCPGCFEDAKHDDIEGAMERLENTAEKCHLCGGVGYNDREG